MVLSVAVNGLPPVMPAVQFLLKVSMFSAETRVRRRTNIVVMIPWRKTAGGAPFIALVYIFFACGCGCFFFLDHAKNMDHGFNFTCFA